ncbi:hypothetical protein BDR26DRAFT_469477 [Obelidium mucronatum]|nr:hypothetical protein BDR26DRAFT_469477 [Obelidium mucronatum]
MKYYCYLFFLYAHRPKKPLGGAQALSIVTFSASVVPFQVQVVQVVPFERVQIKKKTKRLHRASTLFHAFPESNKTKKKKQSNKTQMLAIATIATLFVSTAVAQDLAQALACTNTATSVAGIATGCKLPLVAITQELSKTQIDCLCTPENVATISKLPTDCGQAAVASSATYLIFTQQCKVVNAVVGGAAGGASSSTGAVIPTATTTAAGTGSGKSGALSVSAPIISTLITLALFTSF